MSRLALGTAQFGLRYGIANRSGQVSRTEAAAMLALARAHRVDMLDTAIAYGDSERALGELGTEGLRVVTKLPAVPEQCDDVEAWVRAHIAAARERLRLDRVYGVLLHRPDQLLGEHGRALARAMENLKEDGQAERIGVSVYSADQLGALMASMRIDLVQAPFNIVDRRLASSGWLARLKGSGIEVHTRSAFLQGLLLMPPERVPPGFARWADLFARWQHWLAERRIGALQACLGFALSEPGIDRVIVGADTAQQLREIMNAQQIFPSEWPDLSSEAEALINPFHWSSE